VRKPIKEDELLDAIASVTRRATAASRPPMLDPSESIAV